MVPLIFGRGSGVATGRGTVVGAEGGLLETPDPEPPPELVVDPADPDEFVAEAPVANPPVAGLAFKVNPLEDPVQLV